MKLFIKLALLCLSLVIAISGCTALSSMKHAGDSASDAADPPPASQPDYSPRLIFYDSYATW